MPGRGSGGCGIGKSSKSSIKAESLLLATEVFPDEFKNSKDLSALLAVKKRSLVGVRGGVAEHKEGAGPMEALEFFFDTTTPILIA